MNPLWMELFSASLWVCLDLHLELLLLLALLLGMGLDMELDLQQACKLLALLLDLYEPVPGQASEAATDASLLSFVPVSVSIPAYLCGLCTKLLTDCGQWP